MPNKWCVLIYLLLVFLYPGGNLFTAWSKQGMENIFIEKIDKVVEQPIM